MSALDPDITQPNLTTPKRVGQDRTSKPTDDTWRQFKPGSGGLYGPMTIKAPHGEPPICCPEKPYLKPADRWADGWKDGDQKCDGCGSIWRPEKGGST